MTREDLASRVHMLIVCLSIGLAGLFGPAVWATVVQFFIGWSIGVAFAFFRKWIWK